MIQEAAEEIIEIEHSEEGTSVRIEDPSFGEVTALLVVSGAAILIAYFMGRKYLSRRRE